ncbi:MAG: hypothetical protein WC894_06170 [Patescibacteria group bacterium]
MNDYSGQNYSIWQTTPLQPEEFTKLSSKEQLTHLCLTAHLAPSSHNTQPWRFEIVPDRTEIIINIDKELILPASDINGRQTIISIGCAIANIKVAANYFGYQVETTILNNDKQIFKPTENHIGLIPIIKVKMLPKTSTENFGDIYQAIFKRKVTRAEYLENSELPVKILEEINSFTNDKIKIHIVSDRLRRLTISEFQGQADNFVINSKKFSRELGEWLLPNNTTSNVGMPGIGFGLGNDEADRLHRGLKGEIPLNPADGLKFSTGGKIGIEKSPAICFLTAADDTIENWIAAGEIVENIFLKLVANGIMFTMHAGITEVSLINKLFSMSFLGTSRKILSLFRMGYLKRIEDGDRPHSPRLPLDKVIINY